MVKVKYIWGPDWIDVVGVGRLRINEPIEVSESIAEHLLVKPRFVKCVEPKEPKKEIKSETIVSRNDYDREMIMEEREIKED
jgi:hypothetical protein